MFQARVFFFLRCSFGGKIAFVGRENVKNIQKTNKICYCLGGGGNLKLREKISSPKGPEKKSLFQAIYYDRKMC